MRSPAHLRAHPATRMNILVSVPMEDSMVRSAIATSDPAHTCTVLARMRPDRRSRPTSMPRPVRMRPVPRPRIPRGTTRGSRRPRPRIFRHTPIHSPIRELRRQPPPRTRLMCLRILINLGMRRCIPQTHTAYKIEITIGIALTICHYSVGEICDRTSRNMIHFFI